jgi:hypothetical protein
MAAQTGNTHGGAGTKDGDFYSSSGHEDFPGNSNLPIGGCGQRRQEAIAPFQNHAHHLSRQSGDWRSQVLRVRFGLGGNLLRLFSQGLIDFQVGHFQFAQQVDQKALIFGGQMTGGLFVQHIEHVD